MVYSTPYHDATSAKTVCFQYTSVGEAFSATTVNTRPPNTKLQTKSGFIWEENVLPCIAIPSESSRHHCSRAALWRCFKVESFKGRRARRPPWCNLFRTVWSEIRIFVLPGVSLAVCTAVTKRFRRWINRMCLSLREVVTRGLSLRGRFDVLPVSLRRIISR